MKAKILLAVPEAEVLHIGGTAVPGAYTKGDLDIQIRVSQKQFKKTVQSLKKTFEVGRSDLWNGTYAFFKEEKLFPGEKIDLLVTAIGSKYDSCHKIRDLLSEDKNLLKEYNKLKSSFTGRNYDYKLYKAAKSEFYKKIGELI